MKRTDDVNDILTELGNTHELMEAYREECRAARGVEGKEHTEPCRRGSGSDSDGCPACEALRRLERARASVDATGTIHEREGKPMSEKPTNQKFPEDIRVQFLSRIAQALLTSSTNFNSAKDKESCKTLAERAFNVLEAIEDEWATRAGGG